MKNTEKSLVLRKFRLADFADCCKTNTLRKIFLFAVAACVVSLFACKGGAEKAANNDSSASLPSNEPAGAAIMAKNDCNTCHTADTKIVGPSFKEIAAKYPNTPENVALLTGKVIAGGSGVWGTTPMAGHPGLSKGDAEQMVKYILSMK